MLECTSATSGMHDGVSSNVASVAMKTKYVATRSTSRSTETQTQLSSKLTSATLQPTPTTTLKAPSIYEGALNTSMAPWFQNHWVEPYEGRMNPTQWL